MLPPVNLIDAASGRFLLFAGKDLLSAELYVTGHWEPTTRAIAKILLTQAPSGKGTIVDAGANMGAFSIPLAREVSSDITFHCFEMQRIVYYQLCGNIILNRRKNIHAHNIGLGQSDGWIDVPVPNHAHDNVGAVSASAEVRRLRNEQPTDAGGGELESVRFQTIDTFAFKDLRLLKIDVEGMERDVLLGARNTLEQNQHPPILLELWNADKRPQFSELIAKVLSCLANFGYSHQVVGDLCLAQFGGRPQLKLSEDKESGGLRGQWEPA